MPRRSAGTIWQIPCIPMNLRRSGVGSPGDNRQVLVEVSSRRFAIPPECPCCGALPDTELAVPLTAQPGRPVAPDTARSVMMPYCQRCVGHSTRWEAAGVASAAIMLAGIVGGIVLALTVHLVAGLAAVVVAAPLAYVARQVRRNKAKAACGESCAGPGRAVAYLGWSGTTSVFEFDSHTYTARFAEANPKLIANASSSLAKLVEGHRVARLAVPTPAASVVVPPPATVHDWIAKLEASIGAVSRRTTLQRAIDVLEHGERQLVIIEATKLELAPIHAELDGLDAPQQRQRLERAIEAVRADNMPEPLQVAVLYALEQELRARK
jgi:hypothetical protein